MAKTNLFGERLLKHYLWNDDHVNIGDAAGLQNSAAAGNVYISLHTASPGETGTATTNEATYGGYARVAVARSSAQWTFTSGDPAQMENTNAVVFAACSSGSNTITHFGIAAGATGSGNNDLLYHGALTASLAVSTGIVPEFAASAITVTED